MTSLPSSSLNLPDDEGPLADGVGESSPSAFSHGVAMPHLKEAQATFDRLRIQACELLTQASELATHFHLSDIEVQQARCAAGIAGAQFHQISIHGADPQDFELVEQDLKHIANKVGGLIEAIGDEVKANTAEPFDRSSYVDVFEEGYGNLLGELHCARDRTQESMESAE